jgi:Zn-dependent peptidase ImmA (M78 family)
MATKFNQADWEAFLNGVSIEENNVNICNTTCDELTNVKAIYDAAKEKNIQLYPLAIKDIVEILFGIKVHVAELDRATSGYIERTGENEWVIYINQYENEQRQKFTIAHELGHFIKHRDILLSGSHVDQVLFRDDQNSQIEMEASQFAADLLMPEDKFKEYITEGYNTIDKLSEKFDLSAPAVRYRAYKLGYVKEY